MAGTTRAMFHANLSHAHPDEEYHLWANGARYPLQPHTDKTRAHARAAGPDLAEILDEMFTHFAEVPELPDDTALRVHLVHTTKSFDNAAAEFAPGNVVIYVPPAVPGATVQLRIDYVSTAKALLFHHPDLITQDPEVARTIHEHIDGNKDMQTMIEVVAELMRRKGPPRPNGGWAHLVPFTPPKNPNPRAGIDGTVTKYEKHPIPEIKEALGPIMTLLLKLTKNDPRLKGKKWHQESGKSVSPAHASPHAMTNVANIEARTTDTWRPALADDRKIHGLTTSIEFDVKDAAQRKIKVKMKNYFIRYLGAYIRFFDAAGNAIPLPGWKPEGADEDVDVVKELGIQYIDCHYMGFISPIANVFAIPIDDMPGELEVTVQFPENAVRASIYGSGLGRGSNEWPNTPVIGGILTGFINLGIPGYMLASSVAAVANKVIYNEAGSMMKKSELRQKVLMAGMVYFLATARDGHPNFRVLIGMSKLLFNEGATQILLAVEEQMVAQEILEAIPFAGWVLMALDIATGLAQLAETIMEVSSSRWNIENIVATAITSTVTVHPDPRHMAFPQAPAGTQASYTVRMLVKGDHGDTRPTVAFSTNIPASTPTTLSAAFPNNTLGGTVRFEADYHIDSWLAGTANSGWINNDEPHATQVELFLVENPKPLDHTSVYIHSAILIYDNGQYAWQPTATAPTTTVGNRDQVGPNGISECFGISLSQRCAMLGFAWRANGMGLRTLPNRPNDPPGQQLAAFQNIDIPGRPMVSTKFPNIGFDGMTQLMYDPYPAKFQMQDGNWVLGPDHNPLPDPNDVRLGDYYLDPRPADLPLSRGGGYHLRRVTLDASTPFDLGSTQSWGRFEFGADSFALHPAGFLVGVSSKHKKIQIVPIADEPSSDLESIIGDVYAGEALHEARHGLLFNPIAVTCSYDGTIFILENIGRTSAVQVARIQAFDLIGNPVPCFTDDAGAPTPVLMVGDAATTVLDLVAVGNEVTTYIYLLSYQNDGLQASDYHMTIYTRGSRVPPQQPLVTTPGFAAAKICVDMWHSLYALNYAMTTNAAGVPSGPVAPGTGPAGRTVPSISEWLPPILKSQS
jgi:hypothetical protein